ncbi:MAG: hypothetical protein IJZ19_07650 [Lentisphaeria bacterium]|nr:hypothetical protein [Lentisphaeria bacterium]MBQ8754891.1 hypothetical protein [Lentisphaeria bacterium]
MKKLSLLILLCMASVLCAEKVNLVQNGDFSKGKLHWQLHRCFLVGKTIEFSNKQPDYIQLSQKLAMALPADRAFRLEADLEVSDPYDVIANEKGWVSQLKLACFNANKKWIHEKGRIGAATNIKPCTGIKTFVFTGKIPPETAFAEVIINSRFPLKVTVHEIRLFMEMTPEEKSNFKVQ